MELSAWDIYWVLQLDSVRIAFLIVAVLLSTAAVFAVIHAAEGFSANPDIWRAPEYKADAARRLADAPRRARFARKVGAACLVSWTVCALLPSSKTAAAMIIVPAIVNNETIQKEAADLYGLAKQALREAVEDEEPKK